MFSFEQCLLCFAFHPDMWYEATSFLETTGRELIERGVSNFSIPIILFVSKIVLCELK